MIASLKTIGKPTEEILSLLQETLTQWLPTQDATSSDLEANGLGYAGWLDPVLTVQDGIYTHIRCPFVIGSAMTSLRRTMAEPERGAWTWVYLRVSADKLQPHPCDAQHTPDWLTQGVGHARTAPPPYPNKNGDVHQAITEQERDVRRNS